jgi:hypothetical protein
MTRARAPQQVPRLSCLCTDVEEVKRQHLFAHVWDKDRGQDELIGTATISLAVRLSAHPSPPQPTQNSGQCLTRT